ncbi:MAG: zinc-ribbon domain-containing protein [Oscillospiraceae bacterium]|nr:zinc-ribbon domain-containing protein [Oscillospiraceae bacterium]
MFCSNCGTKLQEGAKFCHNCGAPVISNAAPAETAEPAFTAPVFKPAEPDITSAPVQEPVPEPAAEDIPEPSFSAPVYTPSETQTPDTCIPEPAFAAPEFTPAEPVVSEAPVMEMPHDIYTQSASPYTSASPFDQNAPVSAEAPKEIGGEVPSYSYTYGMPQTSAPRTAENSSIPTDNPYTAAAPVTQTQGTYTAPAGSKKGSKSEKRKRLIAIVIVFALLAGCWYWFFGRGNKNSGGDITPAPDPVPSQTGVTDPTELPEYAEAVSAMENGDYDTAIDILEELSGQYLESDEVFSKLLEACGYKYQYILENNDYAANEDYLNRVCGIMPENADVLRDSYYTEWLKAIYRGDIDGDFYQLYTRTSQYLSDENKELLDNILSYETNVAQLIAENVDDDKRDLASYVMYAQRVTVQMMMEARGNKTKRIHVDGCEYSDVILYYDEANERYFAYYGGLDQSGARSGNGTLLCCYEYTDEYFKLYYYTCEWSGDLPNGAFDEYIVAYDMDLNNLSTDIWKGTLAHGLYDGEFYQYYNGSWYQGEYSSGKCVSNYGTNDNGYIAVMVNVNDPNNFLYVSPEDNELTYGVDFY